MRIIAAEIPRHRDHLPGALAGVGVGVLVACTALTYAPARAPSHLGRANVVIAVARATAGGVPPPVNATAATMRPPALIAPHPEPEVRGPPRPQRLEEEAPSPSRLHALGGFGCRYESASGFSTCDATSTLLERAFERRVAPAVERCFPEPARVLITARVARDGTATWSSTLNEACVASALSGVTLPVDEVEVRWPVAVE